MHCSASLLCAQHIRIGRDRFGADRLRLPSLLANDGSIATNTTQRQNCNGEHSRKILQLWWIHVSAYITSIE